MINCSPQLIAMMVTFNFLSPKCIGQIAFNCFHWVRGEGINQ